MYGVDKYRPSYPGTVQYGTGTFKSAVPLPVQPYAYNDHKRCNTKFNRFASSSVSHPAPYPALISEYE
jgi:hypothetical protein